MWAVLKSHPRLERPAKDLKRINNNNIGVGELRLSVKLNICDKFTCKRGLRNAPIYIRA